LKDDFILVEIDAGNVVKVDREPAQADRASLVERLSRARDKTGRNAMLLSTDYRTLHRYAVMACDAANEIGLQIKVATPAAPASTKGPGLNTGPAAKASRG
jgi:biopolymer transport protein ExbD